MSLLCWAAEFLFLPYSETVEWPGRMHRLTRASKIPTKRDDATFRLGFCVVDASYDSKGLHLCEPTSGPVLSADWKFMVLDHTGALFPILLLHHHKEPVT